MTDDMMVKTALLHPVSLLPVSKNLHPNGQFKVSQALVCGVGKHTSVISVIEPTLYLLKNVCLIAKIVRSRNI